MAPKVRPGSRQIYPTSDLITRAEDSRSGLQEPLPSEMGIKAASQHQIEPPIVSIGMKR